MDFNQSYPTQTQPGYSYVPEMQGMTDIQNRQFINKMNTQVGNFNNAGARSNLQSSGAFLAGRAGLGAKTALGEQDIANQNMYKNALFSLQDRRAREQRQFQTQMADANFQRQMQMYKTKLADQQRQNTQSMIGGGLGSLAGMVISGLPGSGSPAGLQGIMQLLGMGKSNQDNSDYGGSFYSPSSEGQYGGLGASNFNPNVWG